MYKSLLLYLSHFYSLLGHLLEETGRREETKSSLPESGCGWVLWTIGSVPCASPSQHGQFHPNLRLAPARRCPLWWCHGQPLSGTWGGVWGRQRWTGGWEKRGKMGGQVMAAAAHQTVISTAVEILNGFKWNRMRGMWWINAKILWIIMAFDRKFFIHDIFEYKLHRTWSFFD